MILIDTHCHLYLPEFENDIDEVIERAAREGVKSFFLPAIDSTVFNDMIALESRFPGRCFAMMGLHPCSVKENHIEELQIVENWLKARPFVAIGEIGLDYYWDRTFAIEQEKVFRFQIELALYYHLPVVIHSRNAMQETINIVNEYIPKGLRGIFHCFSGSYENAQEIIRAGFYLGIGGVVTYKNGGLAEVLNDIELTHLVLETDAPYLTPVPYRGKRNESSFLKYVLQKLAIIKNRPVEEVAAVTTENAKKIFGL
jgi:TatD DNase family protein